MEITTIINFCTKDYKFLKHCINNIKDISEEVIVSYSTHLFNGELENKELILKSIDENRYNNVKFVELEYTGGNSPAYWCNRLRQNGFDHSNKDIEYYLFVDVDEIFEQEKLNEWLLTSEHKNYDAVSFAGHWYFRDTCYRAINAFDHTFAGLLIKKEQLFNPSIFHAGFERWGMLRYSNNHLHNKFINNEAIMHHYSWVRTKEEMLSKVNGWGHSGDRDWVRLIEDEFTHEFNYKDFIFNWDFEKIEPLINV